MLILTRRPQETIVIDERIFVTVVGIKDDFIRIRTINLGEVSITCTRAIGESFNISDNIKLSLIRVKGIQVRIGIDAPKGISVHREEIYQRIQADKLADKATAQKASA